MFNKVNLLRKNSETHQNCELVINTTTLKFLMVIVGLKQFQHVRLPEFILFTSLFLMVIFILVSAQIKLTVQGLFDLNQNIPAFKEHLRDFMVQIKVFFLFCVVFIHLIVLKEMFQI